MKRAYVTFLGCKVNQYESEYMIEQLEQHGFVMSPNFSEADLCVLNTCAVTSEAARKSRQLIRKLRRSNPDAVIVATGCYAHIDAQSLIDIGANIIIGNNEKRNLVNYIARYFENSSDFVDVSEPDQEVLEKVKSFLSDRTRAYIKLEDGCNEFCSYCIVPKTRGKQIRSKPVEVVIKEMNDLLNNGYKEIVLTGVNLGKYGRDIGTSLSMLLRTLLNQIHDDSRIRLSSINVQDLSDELISLFALSNKLCPHLHIPLQSGSNRILQKMNRKYTVEEALDIFEKLKSINQYFSFTTDVIVGFPGETIGDFLQTQELIKEIGFVKVHIFKYSSRPGTVASKLGYHISNDEKERRAKELAALCKEISEKYRKKSIGKIRHVLVENNRSGICSGYDEYYVRHEFADGDIGNIERVIVKCVSTNGVVSVLADLEGALA
jgi:threonylcarbamoyladenosine tRNA methylthiotransferase MtaB